MSTWSASPFSSPRDTAALLGTWSGAERLAIESAMRDAELSRQPVRDALRTARAALGRVLRAARPGRPRQAPARA